jgi:hypothetical protein
LQVASFFSCFSKGWKYLGSSAFLMFDDEDGNNHGYI